MIQIPDENNSRSGKGKAGSVSSHEAGGHRQFPQNRLRLFSGFMKGHEDKTHMGKIRCDGKGPTPMEVVARFVSRKIKAKKPYKELPLDTELYLTIRDLMELVEDAKKNNHTFERKKTVFLI